MATKLITKEEWDKVVPPFKFMKVKNPSWSSVHREMIVKWLETHTGSGWVYWDGQDTYVFQSSGDFIMFKMWIKDDPFNEDGEIDG